MAEAGQGLNGMAIADRYILRQVAKPILTAIMIGMMVLLAERLVRLLDVTLGKRNSFSVVFELLAYLVPHYLGLAVPLSLFLGILLGFNKISKDSELDAFLAAGIGLNRLARPLLILSTLLAAFSFFVYGWAQPYTRYAYRAVMYTVENVQVFYLAEEGVFMQSGTRTFILDKLNRSQGAFEHIFIFDYAGTGPAETTTASHGQLIEVPGETRPVLRLEDGNRLKLGAWPDFTTNDQPLPGTATFNQADTPLGSAASKIFRPRGEDERERTIPELVRELASGTFTEKTQRYWDDLSELNGRLVMIASTILLPVLALPFSLTRRRSQRASRMAIAVMLVVAYHQIVDRGEVLVMEHHASIWIAQWTPFVLLFGFALWRYWVACFRLPGEQLDRVMFLIFNPFAIIKRRILSRFRGSEA